MNTSRKQLLGMRGPLVPRPVQTFLAMLLLCGWAFVPVAQAQFPPAGDDEFPSKGVFRVTLTEALGGDTVLVKASGPTCVVRSGPHAQGLPAGTLSGFF